MDTPKRPNRVVDVTARINVSYTTTKTMEISFEHALTDEEENDIGEITEEMVENIVNGMLDTGYWDVEREGTEVDYNRDDDGDTDLESIKTFTVIERPTFVDPNQVDMLEG